MTRSTRRAIQWASRLLGIAFTLFISLFAFDVFAHGQSILRALPAFFMHLIPSFVLLLIVVLAWRWAWIGAAGSAALCILFLSWNYTIRHNVPAAVAIIAGPLLLMTVLYLWSWVMRRELGETPPHDAEST